MWWGRYRHEMTSAGADVESPLDLTGRVERCPKRIRVWFGGRWVVDTIDARLVWDHPWYPRHYVPLEDTDGVIAGADLIVDDAVASGAVTVSEDPRLEGFFALEFASMDRWFEEDEEMFVHARDPHKRIDIVAGSRRVRIEVDGTEVAESGRCLLLSEPRLPARWYLPLADVRLGLLSPSDTVTYCPYKGRAEYWHVRSGGEVNQDLAWGYRYPVRESAPIAGHVCFFAEKVDTFVDGVLQPRPVTRFV